LGQATELGEDGDAAAISLFGIGEVLYEEGLVLDWEDLDCGLSGVWVGGGWCGDDLLACSWDGGEGLDGDSKLGGWGCCCYLRWGARIGGDVESRHRWRRCTRALGWCRRCSGRVRDDAVEDEHILVHVDMVLSELAQPPIKRERGIVSPYLLHEGLKGEVLVLVGYLASPEEQNQVVRTKGSVVHGFEDGDGVGDAVQGRVVGETKLMALIRYYKLDCLLLNGLRGRGRHGECNSSALQGVVPASLRIIDKSMPRFYILFSILPNIYKT
jgi:hypothetical protein